MRQDSDTRDQQPASGTVAPVPAGQRTTVEDDRPVPVEGEQRGTDDAARDERVWDGSAEPVEDRTEAPSEDRVAEPSEDRAAEPSEDRAGKPLEDRAEAPAEDRAEEPAEDRAAEFSEDRAEEPVEDRVGMPVEDRAGAPAEDRAEEPVEDRAGVPVEDRAGVPVEDRAELSEDRAAEPFEDRAGEPVEGRAEEPVEGRAVGEAVEDLPAVERPDERGTATAEAEDVEHKDAVLEEQEKAEDLKPGEAPVAASSAALWQGPEVEGFRDRWREVQVRFLDDPQAAAEEAERLLADALESMTEVLAGHKRQLDDWRSAQRQDTEQLRVTVRGYRDLLDRVLAL